MLRVERIKPNIICVGGVQFKPGETKVTDKDALLLMETRQFKGAIVSGDMRILERPEYAKVAEDVVTQDAPKPQQKPLVSRKTAIRIVKGCSVIEELEGMLESQKDNTVRKAIKSRIAFLTVEDTDTDAE